MDLVNNPFIAVEGIFNFRDIGGYPIEKDPLYSFRHNFIFRCANTGNISSEGMQQIQDLGIKTIFDLRSTSEIEKTQDFAPTTEIPGVNRVHVSLFDGQYHQQTVESIKRYTTENRLVSSSYVSVASDCCKADHENKSCGLMLASSKMARMPSGPSSPRFEIVHTKATSSFAMGVKIGLASLSL